MEEVVASIGTVIFDIERDLDEQIGALPLPFPGMDKSGAATCVFHLRGLCARASMCPFRHIKPDRTIVCKHWLRGLCKKGDSCEFLHEYDMSKMPECYFYSKFRACSNKECPFLHIDPESKVKDCPWYDRGFCRHGPSCRHRHTRRVACINYLCGFCPDGPACKFVHMRFDIPNLTGTNERTNERNTTNHSFGSDQTQSQSTMNEMRTKPKGMVICHYCNEPGHKIYVCNAIPPDQKDEVIQKFLAEQKANYANRENNHHYDGNNYHNNHPNHRENFNRHQNFNHNNRPSTFSDENLSENAGSNITTVMGGVREGKDMTGNAQAAGGGGGNDGKFRRPLDQVTCFKCGEKGHYANKCPKGYLAFLSPALNNLKRNEPDT